MYNKKGITEKKNVNIAVACFALLMSLSCTLTVI